MNFIQDYLDYNKETEPPYVYHRWCAITAIGALIGRNCYLQHGSFRIFPNIYTMLLGEPAARKSTAIKIMKKLLTASGYETFAAEKTTKEKFLLDLEGLTPDDEPINGSNRSRSPNYDNVTADNLWGRGSGEEKEPREMFIAADEWNDFAGAGNLEFYTTLGSLWDWDDISVPYRQRVKNSRSVAIWQPTISILAGNTPENFAKAFPPEIIGQGFMSRMLLIHGERLDDDPDIRRFTFPPTPSSESTKQIVDQLKSIRKRYMDQTITVEAGALSLLESIYHAASTFSDARFKSYNGRRFTHLLRLAVIVAISRGTTSISDASVIEANTYLSAAERNMPTALGEFGKSKHSDVTNRIMDILDNARAPISVTDIWAAVHQDLDKMTVLQDIMQNLMHAGKIQLIKGGGWLPKKKARKDPVHVDWSLLTDEERRML